MNRWCILSACVWTGQFAPQLIIYLFWITLPVHRDALVVFKKEAANLYPKALSLNTIHEAPQIGLSLTLTRCLYQRRLLRGLDGEAAHLTENADFNLPILQRNRDFSHWLNKNLGKISYKLQYLLSVSLSLLPRWLFFICFVCCKACDIRGSGATLNDHLKKIKRPCSLNVDEKCTESDDISKKFVPQRRTVISSIVINKNDSVTGIKTNNFVSKSPQQNHLRRSSL